MGDSRDSATSASLPNAGSVLSAVSTVPRAWAAAMAIAAVLSSIKIEHTGRANLVTFEVGSAALVAIGLVWLPAALKAVALAGGTLKAAGVEASLPGVLTQVEAIELGVKARQVTEANGDAERITAAVELEGSIFRLASPLFAATDVLPLAALDQLARNYDRLRRETPAGPTRTSAMTRIVNEAAVRASTSVTEARAKAPSLLASSSQGDRIVGLALTQETGDPSVAREVLHLVTDSATAFEMFHALRALQEMAPALSSAQRELAISTLETESADPRSVGIAADPGLAYLLPRTLRILRASE